MNAVPLKTKHMNIGIIGNGAAAEAIGTALMKKKHNVLMGGPTAGAERGVAWVKKAGQGAAEGSYEEATLFGALVFICLEGAHALEVLRQTDPDSVAGKIVVDLTNPLDYTRGNQPCILKEFRDVSLGESIQELLPEAYVIKALNTVNHQLMADARLIHKGDHSLFVCGNDANAKNQLKHFLVDNFYWRADGLYDLGGIEAARSIESVVPFFIRVHQTLGTPLFNFKVVH